MNDWVCKEVLGASIVGPPVAKVYNWKKKILPEWILPSDSNPTAVLEVFNVYESKICMILLFQALEKSGRMLGIRWTTRNYPHSALELNYSKTGHRGAHSEDY